ncbi:MAG: extracellular solute-binding protein [Rhodobacteraceae bacterium]|jgi:iron(III) transport system substrate-binding protein|nr:extracellular solute-binding protein [Paracoccaceae bacterium]
MNRYLLTGAAAVLLAGAAGAQETPLPDYYPETYGEIVEGSRSENRLVIYSNMAAEQWAPVIDGFNARYPWIQVETLDLASSEVLERFLAETGTGASSADLLVTVAPDAWQNILKRDVLQDYASPEAPHMPDWSIPEPGFYTVGVDPTLIVWNKQMLTPEQVPSGLGDLAAKITEHPGAFPPGSLTTYSAHTGSYGYTLAHAVAARHGDAFWEWAAVFGPLTRPERANGQMLEKLTTGEYVLGYFIGAATTWNMVKDPQRAEILGWSFVSDGNPMTLRGMGIPDVAGNPNAAKLMLDTLLSHEGQVNLAKGGRTPLRPDVTPEDIGGAPTFASISEALGDVEPILIDYDPALLTDQQEFVARWKQVYGISE